jgi:hypothetical protein
MDVEHLEVVMGVDYVRVLHFDNSGVPHLELIMVAVVGVLLEEEMII